ncbi:helix-turn-helix domain-containing protein [Gilliamella sp. B2776]|uniref:helix-turn-helix domain-containing protein n=1 Tax=unclassified Gilliamella TaxID=2685620 RepID=UPI0023782EB8|nr:MULTISPECIES: helix-turn-helix transcriptional regulator [unclassified Gilliamella]MCX8649377.1 helix-turn-helix domain-containing protein [Gilliamella sp. B2779]MCX8654762.1 helix-turn-helix domain-containing protein [Gilliamella sp. B2737]MCX8655782.1 helix-turn-helix domain-containing protein [Gilliamella sp. B2894]MCX8691128.1 helix-turn-helix domain-containing protein [Gilliamella sp. B2776]MCX8694673.1 helix-turn-helix domain-containing protein [Gilliamella sp. B2881]
MKIDSSDWHPADIIAALKKKGTTLANLSRQSGLSSSTLSNALARPWTKGEFIIAQALNMEPHEIWPSRYIDSITNQPIKRVLRLKKKKKRKSMTKQKKINKE